MLGRRDKAGPVGGEDVQAEGEIDICGKEDTSERLSVAPIPQTATLLLQDVNRHVYSKS